jgi:hypothetical protein
LFGRGNKPTLEPVPIDTTVITPTDTVKPIEEQPVPILQGKDTLYITKDTVIYKTDTVVREKEIVREVETTVTKQTPVKNNATKTYSFGKYVGSLKNGIPEGDGKMYYNKRIQIAKHDTQNPAHYAGQDDYFDGSWGNGDIVSGYLYDKSGSIKERIIAPKRFNAYDISKD